MNENVMLKEYHILNGDSLKEQFPSQLKGEMIVARECLVDGDVSGSSAEELFANRARFIAQAYQGLTEEEYYRITVSEFEKIRQITPGASVNLWFEEDLFCQVNLWFVLHLLKNTFEHLKLYLVHPLPDYPYSFACMNEQELVAAYSNRYRIQAWEFDHLKLLWRYYQNSDFENMKACARQLKETLPFLEGAVNAHIDRFPANGQLGRPERALLSIMKELKTEEFGPVFKAFCQQQDIYGFGDVQVKRMWEQVRRK